MHGPLNTQQWKTGVGKHHQAGFNLVAQSCNSIQTPLEAAKGLQIPETVWIDGPDHED